MSALNDLNQYWVQSNFLYNSVKIEQLRLRACFLSKNFQNIFILTKVERRMFWSKLQDRAELKPISLYILKITAAR